MPKDPQAASRLPAALPPLRRHRRGRDVVADLGLRAARDARSSPPSWRSTATRRRRRLRQDHGPRAARRAHRRPPPDRQRPQHNDEDVRRRCCRYTNGDAERVLGNLLTLPVGDGFMYVQPLYTRRRRVGRSRSSRFVLVSYKGSVGIGTTLRAAIEDSLRRDVHRGADRGADGDPDRDAHVVALGVADRPRRRPRPRVARRPRSASCSARPRRSSPRPTRRSAPATASSGPG